MHDKGPRSFRTRLARRVPSSPGRNKCAVQTLHVPHCAGIPSWSRMSKLPAQVGEFLPFAKLHGQIISPALACSPHSHSVPARVQVYVKLRTLCLAACKCEGPGGLVESEPTTRKSSALEGAPDSRTCCLVPLHITAFDKPLPHTFSPLSTHQHSWKCTSPEQGQGHRGMQRGPLFIITRLHLLTGVTKAALTHTTSAAHSLGTL